MNSCVGWLVGFYGMSILDYSILKMFLFDYARHVQKLSGFLGFPSARHQRNTRWNRNSSPKQSQQLSLLTRYGV